MMIMGHFHFRYQQINALLVQWNLCVFSKPFPVSLYTFHCIYKNLSVVDHYSDVIMTMMASQITSVSIVCSAVCSGTHQRKHQSSVSLAFVRGIHRWPVNSTHKRPVTWKMFPFDDVIKYPSFLLRLSSEVLDSYAPSFHSSTIRH